MGGTCFFLFHEIKRNWIGHDVYRSIFITTGFGKGSAGAENYRKAMLKNRSEIIKHQEKVMHVAVGIMPNPMFHVCLHIGMFFFWLRIQCK